jgi:hypothetical protein
MAIKKGANTCKSGNASFFDTVSNNTAFKAKYETKK